MWTSPARWSRSRRRWRRFGRLVTKTWSRLGVSRLRLSGGLHPCLAHCSPTVWPLRQRRKSTIIPAPPAGPGETPTPVGVGHNAGARASGGTGRRAVSLLDAGSRFQTEIDADGFLEWAGRFSAIITARRARKSRPFRAAKGIGVILDIDVAGGGPGEGQLCARRAVSIFLFPAHFSLDVLRSNASSSLAAPKARRPSLGGWQGPSKELAP